MRTTSPGPPWRRGEGGAFVSARSAGGPRRDGLAAGPRSAGRPGPAAGGLRRSGPPPWRWVLRVTKCSPLEPGPAIAQPARARKAVGWRRVSRLDPPRRSAFFGLRERIPSLQYSVNMLIIIAMAPTRRKIASQRVEIDRWRRETAPRDGGRRLRRTGLLTGGGAVSIYPGIATPSARDGAAPSRQKVPSAVPEAIADRDQALAALRGRARTGRAYVQATPLGK